jgi:hypothetical protein
MDTMNEPLRPRIARIWRGRTTSAKADEYARYLYERGIEPLAQKALPVQMLREDRLTETEFVTISYWESVEQCPALQAVIPGESITSSATPSF